MIVSNASLSGCAGVNSALCAGAGEGHLRGGSYRTTLTPTGNLVVAVCLGFIGTFGLMNNLLVLVLFCRYKMLRSPINLLLINISISDLLVCVLGTPFSFAASTQGRWLIGKGGCVWYGFANSLFGIVSLISLAVLSYERYSTMIEPTEADSSNYCKISLGITLTWVYSLIWTLPPLFGWSSYGPEGPGTTCSVDWTAKTANNISYIICLFVFCLIVPFLVIVFCYGKLLCAIRQFYRCFQALLRCEAPRRGSSIKSSSKVATKAIRGVAVTGPRRTNDFLFMVAYLGQPATTMPRLGPSFEATNDVTKAASSDNNQPVAVSLVAHFDG
ncbi:opsin-3-like isoform X2 [Dicentrarchus labrax]|uniref:opsin-3-like isoform X2 n=1 Tax=Dicentrarchus labrax TaxID=13489 RepID=UPI0021F52C5F|nr:opsin-3-like isoform X2 [Dicentrarchus labrax]